MSSRRQKLWMIRRGLLPGLKGLVYWGTFSYGSFPPMISKQVKIYGKRKMTFAPWVFIGSYTRITAHSQEGVNIGERSTIREFGIIQCASNLDHVGHSLKIGRGVYIGPRCNIGVGGPINIGDGCQIGVGFTAISENHLVSENEISKTEVVRRGISIGPNSWVGHNVTILDGVTVGEACVIGAGSVITKSFPAHSRIAGNPGKLI